MGRKKIEIKPIKEERNRHVTFNKRKSGLVKKAIELSILCGCEISLVIFNAEGQLFEYCSREPRVTLQKYCEVSHLPHDRLTNEDYSRFAKKPKKKEGEVKKGKESVTDQIAGAGMKNELQNSKMKLPNQMQTIMNLTPGATSSSDKLSFDNEKRGMIIANILRQQEAQQRQQQQMLQQHINQQQRHQSHIYGEKEWKAQYPPFMFTTTNTPDLQLTPDSRSHVTKVFTNSLPSPINKAESGGKELSLRDDNTPASMFGKHVNFGTPIGKGAKSMFELPSPSPLIVSNANKRKSPPKTSNPPKKRKKHLLTIEVPKKENIPLEPILDEKK